MNGEDFWPMHRKERLAKLADQYYIPLREAGDHCDSASEEDLYEYMNGEIAIDRWVAVTYHDGESGGIYYLKTFATREDAEAYTIEHVTDDIFTEAPIAVVDLDDTVGPSGKVYRLKKLIPIFEGSDPLTC